MSNPYLLETIEVEGTAKKGRRPPIWKVFMYANGSFECNCSSWCKNFPRKDCKHILQIKLDRMQRGGYLKNCEVKGDGSVAPMSDRPKRRIKS